MSVNGGKCIESPPWIIRNVETVDGIEFVSLKTRDTGLCRFLYGGTSCSQLPSFLNTLRIARNAVISGAEESMVFDKPSSEWQVRKKMRSIQGEVRGPIVDVPLPSFGNDEKMYPPIVIKMKYTDKWQESVSIEVSAVALEYVSARAQHMLSDCDANPQKRFSHIGTDHEAILNKVYWHTTKNAWVATNQDPDAVQKHRTFRPSNDPASIAHEKEKAIQWSQTGIVSDDDEDTDDDAHVAISDDIDNAEHANENEYGEEDAAGHVHICANDARVDVASATSSQAVAHGDASKTLMDFFKRANH